MISNSNKIVHKRNYISVKESIEMYNDDYKNPFIILKNRLKNFNMKTEKEI